MILIIYF